MMSSSYQRAYYEAMRRSQEASLRRSHENQQQQMYQVFIRASFENVGGDISFPC